MLNYVYLREIIFNKMYVIIGSIIKHMNVDLQPIHGRMDGIQARPQVIRTLVINNKEIQHVKSIPKSQGPS